MEVLGLGMFLREEGIESGFRFQVSVVSECCALWSACGKLEDGCEF